MNTAAVLDVVRKNVLEILPDVTSEQVTMTVSLKELGANSLDRVDVATMSMEDLGIDIPMMKLAKVENVGDLVNVLAEALG